MIKLKSEDEIISTWKGDAKQPLVSICCIAFNHEPYIDDALASFLLQETDFPFEILIHDDASTDNTAEIIREYALKYPKLIRPIYQVENQYSKGVQMNETFNFPRVKGKYVALCEGDDYWVCKDKLSKQKDALERTNLDLCFTSFYERTNDNKLKLIERRAGDYKVQNIIDNGASLARTATLFIRTEALFPLPDWLNSAPVGDFFLQVLVGRNGAICLNEPCSVYRMYVENGWTAKILKSNKDLYSMTEKMLASLEELDKHFVENCYTPIDMASMKNRILAQFLVTVIKTGDFSFLYIFVREYGFLKALHVFLWKIRQL